MPKTSYNLNEVKTPIPTKEQQLTRNRYELLTPNSKTTPEKIESKQSLAQMFENNPSDNMIDYELNLRPEPKVSNQK